MASIGHVAVGMACGRAYSDDPRTMRRAMLAFSAISLWPDLDYIGFVLGVPYGHSLGHRGFTHSILLAGFVGLVAYVYARRNGLAPARTAIFSAVVAVSHPLLDITTFGGGYGCALLWPLSDARFWSPVRLIPVAPLGLRLLSARGMMVMGTELLLFAPFFLFALIPRKRPKAS